MAGTDNDSFTLTDRERLVAEEAAKLAVEKVTNEFYQAVGKTIVKRFFILIGALAVGWVVGKGWLLELPK